MLGIFKDVAQKLTGKDKRPPAPQPAPVDPNDPVAAAGIDVPHSRRADGTWVIHGDVDLSGGDLFELPDLKNVEVEGNFDCSRNNLCSIDNAPRKITGSFNCRSNELFGLKGGPEEVGGDYICASNYLEQGEKLAGVAKAFGRLESDMGNFATPADIPVRLGGTRAEAKKRPPSAKKAAPSVALKKSISVKRPLTLVPRS